MRRASTMAKLQRTASIAQLRRTYTTTFSPQGSVRRAARKFAVPRALLWFALVLIVGGGIFSLLERDQEVRSRRALADFLQRMHATLGADEFHELVAFLGRVDDRVAEEMARTNLSVQEAQPLPAVLAPHDWDWVGACFFCFTAATTIGYGNFTPQTGSGKAFLVVYAFIAIPSCLNAFAEISDRVLDLLARRMRRSMMFEKRIHQAFSMFDSDRSGKLDRGEVRNAMRILGYSVDDADHGSALRESFERGFTACDPDGDNALDLDEFRSFVLTVAPDAALKVELVLSKGYVVLFASAIFVAIVGLATLAFSAFYAAEDWSGLDDFYFTIVTFTTIGFGDLSPDPHPGWFAAIFIAFTFFGLGITATLVRAASDPAFDVSATARGLAPRSWDALVSTWQMLQAKAVDVLGLPNALRPARAQPVVTQRDDLRVEAQPARGGFAAAVASVAANDDPTPAGTSTEASDARAPSEGAPEVELVSTT